MQPKKSINLVKITKKAEWGMYIVSIIYFLNVYFF